MNNNIKLPEEKCPVCKETGFIYQVKIDEVANLIHFHCKLCNKDSFKTIKIHDFFKK